MTEDLDFSAAVAVKDDPPRLHTRSEWTPPEPEATARLIERTVFGTLVTAGPRGLAVSHLPFLLDPTHGSQGCLVSHLAAASDHAELVAAGLVSVAIFRAEHGYISSSWYPAAPIRDSAPTWNFAVVHCHGYPRLLTTPALARHLNELVEHLERGRDKRWRLGELGAGGLERRLPHILGFELPIERLDAKFKMGQDERPADTQTAITRLAGGLDPDLAALMACCNSGQQNKGEACGERDTSKPRAEGGQSVPRSLGGRRT